MTSAIAPTRLREGLRLIELQGGEPLFRQMLETNTRKEIAERFTIALHVIDGCREYYEIEPQPRRSFALPNPGIVEMADRVWELLEPRIDAKISAAVLAHAELTLTPPLFVTQPVGY